MKRATRMTALGLVLAAMVGTETRASPSGAALTLAEALRTARARQPTLRQAQGAQAAAAAAADLARAPLLPQLNASGTYSRATAHYVAPAGSLPPSFGSGPGSVERNATFDTYPFWRLGITASQLVWDFGQTANRWRSAATAAEAQGQTLRTTEAQVALNVRVAFFTARAARDMVGVARETVANLEKHLVQIQGFVEAGTHPAIDLSQARADLASGRVQLINADNAYDVARAQLTLAMGVERSPDNELSDDGLAPVAGEDAGVSAMVDEALRTRPELGNLRLLVRSQEQDLQSARAGHLPALGVNTSFTDNGPGVGQLTWNWMGAVVLSVPILQGGQIVAQTHQAHAQLTEAQAQLVGEEQQVRLELEQARLGIRAGKAAIAAADEAVTNTRVRLHLAEGRYQTGVGNVIELGDAQVAQTTAAAQRVQSEYQLFTARAQLLKALGRE